MPSLVPGLLAGGVDYEIKSGTSDAKWTGPKIPAQVWREVLAFFKWTWTKHKAESQVRLFVNARTNEWAAWAFPQEARSSSATVEVENHPDRDTQRQYFKEADGWLLIGTAHHHCNYSAFQSHTDKNNETSQDGLHITIGNLDSPRYDFHARFYFGECEFAPDMAEFWDIGDQMRELCPASSWDSIARHQMTRPAMIPADDARAFPEQWELNIVPQAPVTTSYDYRNNYYGHNSAGHSNGHSSGFQAGEPYWKRKENALKMVRGLCLHNDYTMQDLDCMMEVLEHDDIFEFLCDAADRHQLTPDDILTEWRSDKDTQRTEAALIPLTSTKSGAENETPGPDEAGDYMLQ